MNGLIEQAAVPDVERQSWLSTAYGRYLSTPRQTTFLSTA